MGRARKLGMCSLTWLLHWPLKEALLQKLNKFSYLWLSSNEPASKVAFDHSKSKSLNLGKREKVLFYCCSVNFTCLGYHLLFLGILNGERNHQIGRPGKKKKKDSRAGLLVFLHIFRKCRVSTY